MILKRKQWLPGVGQVFCTRTMCRVIVTCPRLFINDTQVSDLGWSWPSCLYHCHLFVQHDEIWQHTCTEKLLFWHFFYIRVLIDLYMWGYLKISCLVFRYLCHWIYNWITYTCACLVIWDQFWPRYNVRLWCVRQVCPALVTHSWISLWPMKQYFRS